MSELADRLQVLLEFLRNRGLTPPTRKLAIVELGARPTVNSDGRTAIAEADIVEPAQYEARFDELMASGRPWINVVCLGVYRSQLIVGIEFRDAPAKPSPRTSVNYSGPAKIVSANDWDASRILCIGARQVK